MAVPAYRLLVASLARRCASALLAGASVTVRELAVRDVRAPAPVAAVSPVRRRVMDAVYVVFVSELVCLGLVCFQVEIFLPAGWLSPFRVACGGVLLAGAAAFVPARTGARSLVLERLRPSQRWRRLVLDLLIQLAALGLLAGAVFELARAVPG
jgi:hypothetical protein